MLNFTKRVGGQWIMLSKGSRVGIVLPSFNLEKISPKPSRLQNAILDRQSTTKWVF